MKSAKWIYDQAMQMYNEKAVYWYACYGTKASKVLYTYKKKQYPQKYPPNNGYTEASYTSQYGKRAMDCSGLWKYCLWTDKIGGEPKYDATQDLSANGFIEKGCTETHTMDTISSAPVGALLWKDGHVGIYIGNGYAIESKSHAEGVVKTKVSDRGWKMWGKVKWVEYPSAPTYTAEQAMADIKKVVDKYYAKY